MSNSDFLRLAANARRKQLGQEELGPLEFYGYVMPKVPQHTLGNGELPCGIYSFIHVAFYRLASRLPFFSASAVDLLKQAGDMWMLQEDGGLHDAAAVHTWQWPTEALQLRAPSVYPEPEQGLSRW